MRERDPPVTPMTTRTRIPSFRRLALAALVLTLAIAAGRTAFTGASMTAASRDVPLPA